MKPLTLPAFSLPALRHTRACAALATLVLGLAATAPTMAAQQVWRCGPDGRVFSDRPCSGGSVQTFEDRRTTEELQAARAQARREQKLALALAREREERSEIAPGAGLMSIGPTQAALEAEQRERDLSWQKARRQFREPAPRRLPSAAGTSGARPPAFRRDAD